MTMKAITVKQANKINARNGMGTCEEDGRRTYWATEDDESSTYYFYNKRERDEFVERCNKG
jgi:hypothetical protein